MGRVWREKKGKGEGRKGESERGERVVWVRGGNGEGDRDMQQTEIKTFENSF